MADRGTRWRVTGKSDLPILTLREKKVAKKHCVVFLLRERSQKKQPRRYFSAAQNSIAVILDKHPMHSVEGNAG